MVKKLIQSPSVVQVKVATNLKLLFFRYKN